MSFDFDDFDVRSRFADLDERALELEALLDQRSQERRPYEEMCKIAYVFHDAALDGVVLTYHELRAAIDRKVMSDTQLIPTYQEIKNHSEAFEHIRARAEAEGERRSDARNLTLVVEDAYHLHRMLNRELPRKHPGVLRKDMPLHKTYFHELHDPTSIEGGLKRVFAMVRDTDFRSQHPINQATLFHHEFMHVFPFTHGSGRVGRLLMNYFLIRAGYMPAVIHQCDRQRYYDTIKSGPDALRTLIIDAMESAVENGVRHLKEQIREHNTHRRASMGR